MNNRSSSKDKLLSDKAWWRNYSSTGSLLRRMWYSAKAITMIFTSRCRQLKTSTKYMRACSPQKKIWLRLIRIDWSWYGSLSSKLKYLKRPKKSWGSLRIHMRRLRSRTLIFTTSSRSSKRTQRQSCFVCSTKSTQILPNTSQILPSSKFSNLLRPNATMLKAVTRRT